MNRDLEAAIASVADFDGGPWMHENLIDELDIVTEHANASHGLLIADRCRVDGSVDSVTIDVTIRLLDALQTDPVLTDRVGGIVRLELLAGSRVDPVRIDELGIHPDPEEPGGRGVELAESDRQDEDDGSILAGSLEDGE